MVGTGLSIKRTVHSVAFSELNLSRLFQSFILPPDELVVEWIDTRGDERAIPVYANAKVDQILLSTGREVSQPVVRVLELRDLALGDAELEKNLVLSHRVGLAGFVLGEGAVEFFLGKLSVEAPGSGRNGHSCAMETLWE